VTWRVRQTVPASAPSQTAPQVPVVYLPPFYQAERSVARALLRLLAARADRQARLRESFTVRSGLHQAGDGLTDGGQS
jgi:hypothetical protein